MTSASQGSAPVCDCVRSDECKFEMEGPDIPCGLLGMETFIFFEGGIACKLTGAPSRFLSAWPKLTIILHKPHQIMSRQKATYNLQIMIEIFLFVINEVNL